MVSSGVYSLIYVQPEDWRIPFFTAAGFCGLSAACIGLLLRNTPAQMGLRDAIPLSGEDAPLAAQQPAKLEPPEPSRRLFGLLPPAAPTPEEAAAKAQAAAEAEAKKFRHPLDGASFWTAICSFGSDRNYLLVRIHASPTPHVRHSPCTNQLAVCSWVLGTRSV